MNLDQPSNSNSALPPAPSPMTSAGSASAPVLPVPPVIRRGDSYRKPAWRSKTAWFTLIVVAIGSLAIDLVTKWLAFESIAGEPVRIVRTQVLAQAAADPRLVGTLVPRHAPITIIPHVLDLTLVLNPGAVFGVGPGKRWFFIIFTAIALSFGMWMFTRWTRSRDTIAHAAIGLLMGGGLGNLYDRLALGCVRDFLHPLPGLKFPGGWKPLGGDGQIWPYVSNIADLLLLIGIAMLLLFLWRRDAEAKRVAEAEVAKKAASDSAVPVAGDSHVTPSAGG
ncbi:MAG: signal peptidase II [Pyrinomonadaceae bacterium]|nr:signal peptidase II [Phycisphaerales bacterium]